MYSCTLSTLIAHSPSTRSIQAFGTAHTPCSRSIQAFSTVYTPNTRCTKCTRYFDYNRTTKYTWTNCAMKAPFLHVASTHTTIMVQARAPTAAGFRTIGRHIAHARTQVLCCMINRGIFYRKPRVMCDGSVFSSGLLTSPERRTSFQACWEFLV